MAKKEFKELVSAQQSKVHEKIAWRKANKEWLKKSSLIAINILKVIRERNISQLDFAAQLEVTPQYVNKMLKGSENLTLETITKIERVLNISLMHIEQYQTQGLYKAHSYSQSGYHLTRTIIIQDEQVEERKTFTEKQTLIPLAGAA